MKNSAPTPDSIQDNILDENDSKTYSVLDLHVVDLDLVTQHPPSMCAICHEQLPLFALIVNVCCGTAVHADCANTRLQMKSIRNYRSQQLSQNDDERMKSSQQGQGQGPPTDRLPSAQSPSSLTADTTRQQCSNCDLTPPECGSFEEIALLRQWYVYVSSFLIFSFITYSHITLLHFDVSTHFFHFLHLFHYFSPSIYYLFILQGQKK
jgi:hypothetical protein